MDDLKRRFDCLIAIDLTSFDASSSMTPALVSAEDMFPAQLTWTLVEVVRQIEVTQELIRKTKPIIDQFLRDGERRDVNATYSEEVPEGHWAFTVSDGFDGVIVRLLNEATGEVFFVTEAMPMLFQPARAACHRTSSHQEDWWTPSTQRFYETVVITGDCVPACELLAETGFLERDFDGCIPTEALVSEMEWFRTLATLWNHHRGPACLARTIGDWDGADVTGFDAQQSTAIARDILADGLWTLLKSFIEAKAAVCRFSPDLGKLVFSNDQNQRSERPRRMDPFFSYAKIPDSVIARVFANSD